MFLFYALAICIFHIPGGALYVVVNPILQVCRGRGEVLELLPVPA
jgi:hypothetical protein